MLDDFQLTELLIKCRTTAHLPKVNLFSEHQESEAEDVVRKRNLSFGRGGGKPRSGSHARRSRTTC